MIGGHVGMGIGVAGSKMGQRVVIAQDIKEACRTAASMGLVIGMIAAGDTIGGVVVDEGDRILLPFQGGPGGVPTTNPLNGVYIVGATPGDTVRAFDFDNDNEVTQGALIPVAEGDWANTLWMLLTQDPIEVDVTPINFMLTTVQLPSGTARIVGYAEGGAVAHAGGGTTTILTLDHDFDLDNVTYTAIWSTWVAAQLNADVFNTFFDLNNNTGISPGIPGEAMRWRVPHGGGLNRWHQSLIKRFTFTGGGPSSRTLRIRGDRSSGTSSATWDVNSILLLREED